MRIVFLDFDGPLHPVSAIADKVGVSAAELDHLVGQRGLFRWLPHMEQALAPFPEVTIAVHSSWRKVASNGQLAGYLGNLSDRFIGVTPPDMPRYEGIVYLAERAQATDYIIVDDAVGEFPKSCPNLLPMDPEVGFSDPHALQALGHWLEYAQVLPKERFA